MNDNLFGVHWEVEEPHALWQLTGQNYLRVDVTRVFDAKFRIVAYTNFPDEMGEHLRARIKAKEISAVTCGQEGFKGFERDIFEFVHEPGVDPTMYRLTNNAHLMPGMKAQWNGESRFMHTLAPHPQDGYSVQFNAVPWNIMKRYWRKPINLNRQFHRRAGKYSYSSGVPSIEVLDFDISVLRAQKCFWADFAFMSQLRTRVQGVSIARWMLEHTRGFAVLTDAETPFARAADEVMFTLECM